MRAMLWNFMELYNGSDGTQQLYETPVLRQNRSNVHAASPVDVRRWPNNNLDAGLLLRHRVACSVCASRMSRMRRVSNAQYMNAV